MNQNFQPEIHPDADQLSVFVEGAASAREQERMLAHLAECAECRNAMFLMQPHEEQQRLIVTSVKGRMWRRVLLPVGLAAAALACALVAALIHIRPHGTSGSPQQIAIVRQAEHQPYGTKAPPTTQSAPEPSTYSEQVAGSGKRQKTVAPTATGTQISGAVTPPVGGTVAGTPRVSGGINSATSPHLPVNGRNIMTLQQLQAAETKHPESPNAIANKKDLPGLQIERAREKDETLAGVSGRITDPTGASVSGATVTLSDATGKTRQTKTSADGSFYLTELAAGRYELTVTASGFETSDQSIELNPNELAMLQPKLAVGSASEQVIVEANTQVVQTDSSEVSSVVNNQQVSNLATNGRNAMALIQLSPGPVTVSHGNRFLSLNDAGDLLVSRNGGKKWKKVKSQWVGKVVRIGLTPPYSSEAAQNAKSETGSASRGAIFQLTTESGAIWISKDGAHWRQQ